MYNILKSSGSLKQEVKCKISRFSYNFIYGNEHITTWTWYLVMFQGKLYWTLRTQYYPQQEIVHFKGFDIEPEFGHGGQWTNAKNLHPVYIKNENNEWEMV